MTKQTIRDDLAKLKRAIELVESRVDGARGYFSLFVVHRRTLDALEELREAFENLDKAERIKKFDDLISI